MKNLLTGFECIKKVCEWWEEAGIRNVLNGITFYNRFATHIFYTVSYYNTNLFVHQEIILKVNLETGEVTIKEES